MISRGIWVYEELMDPESCIEKILLIFVGCYHGNSNLHISQHRNPGLCQPITWFETTPKKWGWNPKNHQGITKNLAIFRGPMLSMVTVGADRPRNLIPQHHHQSRRRRIKGPSRLFCCECSLASWPQMQVNLKFCEKRPKFHSQKKGEALVITEFNKKRWRYQNIGVEWCWLIFTSQAWVICTLLSSWDGNFFMNHPKP